MTHYKNGLKVECFCTHPENIKNSCPIHNRECYECPYGKATVGEATMSINDAIDLLNRRETK